IIAMTANAMRGDRELCLDAGMDDYVSKPVRIEDLIAALERCALLAGQLANQPELLAPADRLVDWEGLARLQSDLGGVAIVIEVIDMFCADAPQLLERMRAAIDNAEAQALRHAAHTLKSTSASLGAQALASCCTKIEELARGGALDQAAALLPHAEGLFAQTDDAFQASTMYGVASRQ
ncbi:MAG TPA: response regulator, partial [Roseiflexaceae bacterium]|nr:response regulator [Roseiflexaceae bacterium]